MLNATPAQHLTAVDPRQLGRWSVEARIGSGGMGVVYRARSGEDLAAVKVVRPGLLDDPQVAARFEREAQVLRSVRDEHISLRGIPCKRGFQFFLLLETPGADGLFLTNKEYRFRASFFKKRRIAPFSREVETVV